MAKETFISEMQKFHFGSKIFCSDGEYGTVAEVIFDPTTRSLTQIGVKKSRLFGKVSYLPFKNVTEATGAGVTVSVKSDELATQAGGAPSGAVLSAKSAVTLSQGSGSGTLVLVAVHPESGELAYIVAHHLRPGHDTLLRAEMVTQLESERVLVDLPQGHLETLQPYYADRDLQQQVEDALYDFAPLHIDLKGIQIRVLDGVLYLDGNVSSTLRIDIVQDQISELPGLLEIKNTLVGDDALAGRVALALGQDARTHELSSIGVYPRLGVVRVGGSVQTAQQKAAATEIIRGIQGVTGVLNDLEINSKPDLLRVMSSTGAVMDDQVPGKYVRHTR